MKLGQTMNRVFGPDWSLGLPQNRGTPMAILEYNKWSTMIYRIDHAQFMVYEIGYAGIPLLVMELPPAFDILGWLMTFHDYVTTIPTIPTIIVV